MPPHGDVGSAKTRKPLGGVLGGGGGLCSVQGPVSCHFDSIADRYVSRWGRGCVGGGVGGAFSSVQGPCHVTLTA